MRAPGEAAAVRGRLLGRLRERPLVVPGLILLFGAVHALAPWFLDGYWLSLGISLLSYTVLATAWSLFSGPTRYISLATVAFFGIGAYVVAILHEVLSLPLLYLAVIAVSAVIALLVGLAT